MKTKIKQFSHEDAAELSGSLLEYRDTLDYRNIFASKEWLLSFLEVYKPRLNFLVRSNGEINYFSLSALNNEIVFTGDPFNDFNCAFTKTESDAYDFKKIVEYLSQSGQKIRWRNIFESKSIKSLSGIGEIRDGVICLKVSNISKRQNYDTLMSKRIKQMYERFSNRFSFDRVFGCERKFPQFLQHLLNVRQDKLLKHRKGECNLSFDNKFKGFITKLANRDSLGENIFIDYCTDKNNGGIMASSLNFVKDKKIICYLRSHSQSGNKISYGLILDYWSNEKNFKEGVEIIDYTRGNESYKYRLGAKEYKLKDFATI